MKRYVGLAAVALVFGGCQEKPVKLLKQEAGYWTQAFSLQSFEVPNPPPEYRGDLENALAARSSTPVCLTPEDVAKTDLASQLISGQGLTNCDFDENVSENGLMKVVAVCEDPKGRAVELKITGSASVRSADVVISMVGEEQAAQPVSLELRAVLTHNGPCPAPTPQPTQVPVPMPAPAPAVQ